MTAIALKDRVEQTVTAGGTGALTLGAAVSGFQALAAGDDAKVFPYVIQDGSAWETGFGTYANSGTAFTRTTRHSSSTGGALNVTTSALLCVDLTSTLLGMIVPTEVALAIVAGAVDIDCSKGSAFYLSATSNFNLNAPTNMMSGQTITVRIKQDATGSRIWTPNAVFAFGSGNSVLTATASKRDLLCASYSATDNDWVSVLTKGF